MNARNTHPASTEIQDLISDKTVVSKIARKANTAASQRARNGRVIKLKGAAAAAAAALAATQDDDTYLKGFLAEQEQDNPTPEGNPGVFAALTGTLTAAQAEAAEEAAITAISKAKTPKAKVSATQPADTALYSVGEYKGRAGAMYAFMSRVGDLGDAFTRERVVASIVADPCDPKVSNRAQALDYFAWAYRHGLLVAAPAGAVEAPVVAKKGRKEGRKS